MSFCLFAFLCFYLFCFIVFVSFFLLLFLFFLSFCVHCHVCMSHLQEGEEHLIVQGGWGCHDPNFLCNSRKVLPKVATNLQPFLAFSNKLASATIISNPRHEFCYMPQGPVKAQWFVHPTPRVPNSYYNYYYYSSVRPSQSGDISGTKRGIIDSLVSKQPEKILNRKIQKRSEKISKKYT